jgi:hypothetical protein
MNSVVEMMERHGGSFARAIAAAWWVADPHNRAILESSFSYLFNRYADVVKAKEGA